MERGRRKMEGERERGGGKGRGGRKGREEEGEGRGGGRKEKGTTQPWVTQSSSALHDIVVMFIPTPFLIVYCWMSYFENQVKIYMA